ncbi:ArnT family glycosyltransferase [Maribacter hydrothermalis]|uniref:Dolichyl-phosphate-mannose--protein mannosyltransferase n=1 Tax=Maribacter hydrothermalis TaxID=1836467 RepID=A0A1B7Z1P5_9FLAO|nr:glycosyltransferase family 39 protein [Maribacter hydrothermalis]APQ18289.1 dolichyl-phosphate-mannose--protein mannosyltransferase [Maribacter hydrothermalis]OBR36635.1 dolichyl-phosphate-mannose--protein mannosyltransferase [Maribacter hydrothermalis]
MISNLRYWFLLLLIFLIYVAGMFVTLFENDSAQFSVMAMRMVQENDFFSLFKGPEEYLDKPHMHYWLAAISYKIFGLHDWAYRIPGILSTLLAAYSCYGLGSLLYNKHVGKIAALVFMTAQTIVLGAIDVRTDAVLTGFSVLAIWQITKYIEKGSVLAIGVGAFAAGIAFSTKGQIALLVIGLPILCHLLYTRKWKAFLSWKVIVALFVFGITISPMLYAYYLQFDLHPEKVIRGKDNRSGIFFIFWEQSFERLSGEGIGKNSSDFFFFFHTFLWVFIPWTILGITAFWVKTKQFVKLKFKYYPGYEFLTIGGITLIFAIISFAQFKLPHYLNITIPLFAVLTASYLYNLYNSDKTKAVKILMIGQYFILGVVFIASALICFFVFKLNSLVAYSSLLVAAIIIGFYALKQEAEYAKLITISVCASILLNAVLNLHFYPNLLEYQGGSSMAKVISEKNIPVERIYKVGKDYSWSLDFYNQYPVQMVTPEFLKDKKDIWVYVNDDELKMLQDNGFDWDSQISVNQFRITRLQGKFMNPTTRNKVTRKMHLVHIN